ncbi:MAG TPA: hypothetical protein VG847_02055, partial [Chitinophagaceae bacterium]|nr:hypothetical protein [Chitinophagaceae bacterium]
MKTINLLTTLSLIAVTTVFLQCPRKDYYQPSPQYSFKEPAAITPYHLNYNTGDTVWVHIHIPGKMLTDTISRQSIFYDSASFSAGITVQLLYNNPFVADGAKLADFVYTPYVSAYESVNQNYTGTSITFGCNQSTDYDLLVGIIFIQKGVFGL